MNVTNQDYSCQRLTKATGTCCRQKCKSTFLEFKKSQEKIDEDRKDLMYSLCHEIKLYVTLREQRGVSDPSKYKVTKCKRECNNELKISGHYVRTNSMSNETCF